MRFRKSSHSIYRTECHPVWIPRYRRKIFVKGVKDYAQKLLAHIPDLAPDIEVIKLNVQENHVDMVVVIPPRIAVANAVSFIKTQSAKMLKAKFPFLNNVYIGQEGLWSRGHCISSVRLNEKEILRYVQYQGREDSGQLRLTLS